MVLTPRELLDYRESELEAELRRRKAARDRGRCDYCGGVLIATDDFTSETCRYPRRHRGIVE